MMSKKYKIYLVTKYFHPILTGAGNRFFNLYPYLKAKNIELSVLTIKYNSTSSYEEISGIKIFRSNIDLKKNTNYKLQKFAFDFSMKKIPDAIIFLHHSYRSFIFIALLRMIGIKCIRNVTMMPKIQTINLKQYVIMWLGFKIFSKVYCLNKAMHDRFMMNGLRANKAFIVPNGVDTNLFHPIKSNSLKLSLRKKLKLPNDLKIILFVGNLIKRKGIDLLLSAWAEICNDSNACLVLVGSADSTVQQRDVNFKIELDEKIGRINEDKLIIRDSHKNIEEYYQAADIFVFFSREEGMPNALLEAMSCSLPSLITPFEGLSVEFGRKNIHYFLTSFSIEKIIADMKRIMENNNAKKVGENASLHIRNELSIENCALKLFENIFSRGKNF